MLRALAGSNVEHNCGGAKMSTGEALLFLTVFALVLLVVAIVTDNNGGPFA